MFMDDLELEEPVILGKIEIGVDVGGPDVVNEHLEFSDTERSKENPVVGISTGSGITVVGLRRSQGLVGTGGVESGGRKSHALRVHSGRARPGQRPAKWQTGDLLRKAP